MTRITRPLEQASASPIGGSVAKVDVEKRGHVKKGVMVQFLTASRPRQTCGVGLGDSRSRPVAPVAPCGNAMVSGPEVPGMFVVTGSISRPTAIRSQTLGDRPSTCRVRRTAHLGCAGSACPTICLEASHHACQAHATLLVEDFSMERRSVTVAFRRRRRWRGAKAIRTIRHGRWREARRRFRGPPSSPASTSRSPPARGSTSRRRNGNHFRQMLRDRRIPDGRRLATARERRDNGWAAPSPEFVIRPASAGAGDHYQPAGGGLCSASTVALGGDGAPPSVQRRGSGDNFWQALHQRGRRSTPGRRGPLFPRLQRFAGSA